MRQFPPDFLLNAESLMRSFSADYYLKIGIATRIPIPLSEMMASETGVSGVVLKLVINPCSTSALPCTRQLTFTICDCEHLLFG